MDFKYSINSITKEKLVNDYIRMLLKSQNLHDKLEHLYSKNNISYFKNKILKLNRALNRLMVKIMKLKWQLELAYSYA